MSAETIKELKALRLLYRQRAAAASDEAHSNQVRLSGCLYKAKYHDGLSQGYSKSASVIGQLLFAAGVDI